MTIMQGDTVRQTLTTVMENAKSKRDYVISAPLMRMNDDQEITWDSAAGPVITVPTAHASNQLADYLGIPRKFLERIQKDAPDLISVNVNRLLETHVGESRMIRTMAGTSRAILSDRYRRLDHEDLCESIIIPEILGNPNYEIESIKVTGSKFYCQIVTPKMQGEIRVGDPIQFGIQISNSEIGLGAWDISTFIKRLRCKNGMTGLDFGRKKAHIGGRVFGDGETGILTDETQKAIDTAFWMESRDYIKSLTSQDSFDKVMASLRETANEPVKGDPALVVEELSSRFSLRENESKSVLYSFLSENDHTRWGLANAVTEVANAHTSYDRAVELQGMGGTIMALAGKDWNSIASRGI